MSFKLSVTTPLGEVFQGQVESVLVPGFSGEFMVLTGHAPLLSALKKGIVVITQDGVKKKFNILDGFLEVNASHICEILVEEFSSI